MLERIQKIISAAGITSRRAAEQLIIDGRVRVNGQIVTELGTKADALKDHIKVDGKLINPRQPLVYVMLNKPAGYVTTMADPEGRPTVLNLLKGLKTRVYPVGRLDYNTEGLLLLTNDGDFAHLVTHPKHEFPKTYRAKVKGVLEDHDIEQLENGIYLDDGKTSPAKIKKVSKEEANSWLEITIHEGRKRQVRRMFDRVGHSVIKLKRIKTGNLILGDLPDGAFRYLAPPEVEALKELAVKEIKTETRNLKPEVMHGRTEEGAHRTLNRTGAGLGLRTRGSGREMDAGKRQGARKDGDNGPRRGPKQRAFTDRRKSRVPVSAAGRPWPDDRWSATFGRGSDSTWKKQGPRVPGQGASGRGPRRSHRDEGSMQNQTVAFRRLGTRKSQASEKGQRSMGTVAPWQATRVQGDTRRFVDKPKSRKSVAARIRGKIFDTSADSHPGTESTAGASGKDRTPRRIHDQHERGSLPIQGASHKPYRTRR